MILTNVLRFVTFKLYSWQLHNDVFLSKLMRFRSTDFSCLPGWSANAFNEQQQQQRQPSRIDRHGCLSVFLSHSLSFCLCQSVYRSVPALHWPLCTAVSCRLSTVSCLLCGSLPRPLSPRLATDPPLPACSLYKSHIHCVFLSRFFKRAVIFLCADSRTPLPNPLLPSPFPLSTRHCVSACAARRINILIWQKLYARTWCSPGWGPIQWPRLLAPPVPLCVLLLRHCPMPCIQAGGLDNFALRSAALLSNRLDIVATAAATAAKE